MTRACVPSISNTHTNNHGPDTPSTTLPNSMSFYKQIEDSRWLYQVTSPFSLTISSFSSLVDLVAKDSDDQCSYRSIQ